MMRILTIFFHLLSLGRPAILAAPSSRDDSYHLRSFTTRYLLSYSLFKSVEFFFFPKLTQVRDFLHYFSAISLSSFFFGEICPYRSVFSFHLRCPFSHLPWIERSRPLQKKAKFVGPGSLFFFLPFYSALCTRLRLSNSYKDEKTLP